MRNCARVKGIDMSVRNLDWCAPSHKKDCVLLNDKNVQIKEKNLRKRMQSKEKLVNRGKKKRSKKAIMFSLWWEEEIEKGP